MTNIRKMIYKIPNYINRFGFFDGLRLLTQIERSSGSNATHIKPYQVPGYAAPIYLRDTKSDHATFWQCIVDSQYDFSRFPQSERLAKEYIRLVKSGESPLIIDCGANVGLASLWFANRFPEARIVAVEPDADNFRMLSKNLLHLRDRVTLLHGGIWDQSGNLVITNPNAGSAAFRVAHVDTPSSNSIRAYSIPEICKMTNSASPFIAKIDIEGAQQILFRDNIDWVSGTHLLMLELDDWQMPWVGTSRSFFAVVSRIPFDYLIRGESIFCFRDFGKESVLVE